MPDIPSRTVVIMAAISTMPSPDVMTSFAPMLRLLSRGMGPVSFRAQASGSGLLKLRWSAVVEVNPAYPSRRHRYQTAAADLDLGFAESAPANCSASRLGRSTSAIMVPSMVTSPERKSMREERAICADRLNLAGLEGENVQHPVGQ